MVIVDDMVQSGGTLYKCAEQLLKSGCTEVSAFCTHAVFPKKSWQRFTKGGDRAVFKNFYVTNSNPTVTGELPEGDVFIVLDILPQFMNDL